MTNDRVKHTEYALEEYYNGKFDNQIDIFEHIDEAYDCAKDLNLKEFVIRAIYYDINRNEIETEIIHNSSL